MGAPHSNQHSVPEFLLKRWHTAPDRKLSAFRYEGSRFLHSRLSAKSVCKELHIYSTTAPDGTRDASIERDFLGPVVDDPAAAAHSILVAGPSSAWTQGMQEVWARFIVSLMLREPHTLLRARASVTAAIAEESDLVPDPSEVIDGATDADDLMRWLQKHPVARQDELAIKLLPSLMSDPALVEVFFDHPWAVREVAQVVPDLLIGDRPVIFAPTGDGDYFIALPIEPRIVYLAFTNERIGDRLREIPDDQLVSELNQATVTSARQAVFGSGPHHETMVKSRLRTTI